MQFHFLSVNLYQSHKHHMALAPLRDSPRRRCHRSLGSSPLVAVVDPKGQPAGEAVSHGLSSSEGRSGSAKG